MPDRIPLDHMTSDQLDALYDQLDRERESYRRLALRLDVAIGKAEDAETALTQARSDAASLGAEVVRWHDIAVRHQHWGQRRWNAWKNARARAQRLTADLAALRAVARGYCPHCGRGDAAPTVTDWEQQKHRADQAEATLDQARRLRDDLAGITGARWIATALDHILNPQLPAATPGKELS